MTTAIVVEGLEDTRRAATALSNVLNPASLASFLAFNVRPYLHQRARARFTGEGDDASGPWASLRPATVAGRMAEGYGGEHPILVRTGELKHFVTETFRAWSHGNMAELSIPDNPRGRLRHKFGSAQHGSRKGGKAWGSRNPARPVAVLSAADGDRILDFTRHHIERVFMRARFGI